jgi:hypothetical protein
LDIYTQIEVAGEGENGDELRTTLLERRTKRTAFLKILPGFFRLSIPPGEVLAEELGACGLT